ncbi:MAG: YiiX/YebB-like N1pC/P60 family cysteine hydrolase [Cyclobacterium sp.]|uniref:YiiX/YebB-like N1pC/P60 family cysteine hydrolase n=1 Tax=Cyclobacterium sp. TaxID=1966343 RepID=UPI003970C983
MIKTLTQVSCLVLVLLAPCCQYKPADFDWKEGDILFQDGDCGEFCEAIRKVTSGYDGHHFSHNGIVLKENGRWMVIEAIRDGVILTPLDTFLNRHLTADGNPKVHVGRLRHPYRELIPEALEYSKSLLGKPYDMAFDMSNEAYYCSELIHFSFKKANKGIGIFKTPPMTFLDPETAEVFPVWKKHFENLSLPVPEGKPGLNPGGMTQDPVIEMIFNFESP